MSDYEPTIYDVIWASRMVDFMPPNGIITFPNTNMQYRFHRAIRVLELVNIETLEQPENAATHECTRKIFELLAWRTLP